MMERLMKPMLKRAKERDDLVKRVDELEKKVDALRGVCITLMEAYVNHMPLNESKEETNAV